MSGSIAAAEVFRALGDPIRWSIIQQILEHDELAASILDDTLPVSKPTVSYHVKILIQAGLIEVHKRGRNHFYRLRPNAIENLSEAVAALAPGQRPADGPNPGWHRTMRRADKKNDLLLASGDDNPPQTLLTW